MKEELRAQERRSRRLFITLGLSLAIACVVVNFCLFRSADLFILENRMIGFVLLLVGISLNAASIPITHYTGKVLHNNYEFFQPLKGGDDYVLLQALAWTLYGAMFLTVPYALYYNQGQSGTITLAGVLGGISQVLVTCSILVFNLESADTTLTRSDSGEILLGSIEDNLWYPETRYNVEHLLKIDNGSTCFILFALLNVALMMCPVVLILVDDVVNANETTTLLCCLLSIYSSIFITSKIGFKLYAKFNGGTIIKPFIGGIQFCFLQTLTWVLLLISLSLQSLFITNMLYTKTSFVSAMTAHLCLILSIRYFKPTSEMEQNKEIKEINVLAAKFNLEPIKSLDETRQIEYIRKTSKEMMKFEESPVKVFLTVATVTVFANIQYFLFVFLYIAFDITFRLFSEDMSNKWTIFAHFNLCLIAIFFSNTVLSTFKLNIVLRYVILVHLIMFPTMLTLFYLKEEKNLNIFIGASALHMLYLLYTSRYSPETSGARESKLVCNMNVWKDVAVYFGFKLMKDQALIDYERETEHKIGTRKHDTYLLAFHPHGILPSTLAWLPLTKEFKQMFPTMIARAHTASVLHYVPGLRDISQLLGMRDVYRSTVERSIDESVSPLIAVGGQKEMFLSKSTGSTIRVYAGHKGFIRLAVRKQVPIVPVYSFGEHKLMDNVDLPRVQDYTKGFLGFPMPFFPVGRFFMPIHRRSKVTVCFGRPILPVIKGDKATEEEIEKIHEIYLKELNELFERNKAKCGFPKQKLEFCY